MGDLIQEHRRPYARFIARLSRRHVAVRALEAGAGGLLVACAALIPALAYRLWKHEPSSTLTIAALAAGCIVGIAAGWLRRPTRLASALLADKQLGFKELLSTAWTIRDSASADRDFILDMADRAAGTARPKLIKVRSLTSRAWGGTALALMLVIVLCVMSPAQPRGENQIANSTIAQSKSFALAEPDRPLVQLTNDSAGPSAPPNPVDVTASKLGQNDHGSSTSARDNSPNVNPSPEHRSENQNADGRGGGSGRSNSTQARPQANDRVATNGGKESGNGTVPGGSGSASNPSGGNNGGGATPGVAAVPSAALEAPPWRSNSWPDNVQRAQQAISSGSVPSAYRDLVRAYFQSN